MAMLEEEEEVASRSWNHMAKKGVHTYHLSVISCPGPFCGVVIIRWELLIFLCGMSCMLLQGHKLLRLGARYQLGASNSWDTMAHPQVLNHSVRESVHLISIGSTRLSCLHPQIRIEIYVGRRIVPISLPKPTIICLLEMKTKIIKFNSRK
jgi:hypothetical protein